MRMRWPVVAAGWLAAAALATAASVGAVGTLRSVFGPSDAPLRESDVQAALSSPAASGQPTAGSSTTGSATAGPATAGPSGSEPAGGSSSPSGPAPVTRALATDGGSLVATCTGGLAYLDSWVPRSGWEVDHVVRGPAAVTALRFKARSGGGSVRVQVTCENSEPVLRPGGDD
ncbi:hypothetical protein [Dactylosporangium sp. NPDC051541]|uniref:hypothetical protein n=1 Tax=Dactylosporangium sp. NPDC051541 TaxID=3363977 RepID=UPI0037999CAE